MILSCSSLVMFTNTLYKHESFNNMDREITYLTNADIYMSSSFFVLRLSFLFFSFFDLLYIHWDL